VTIAGVSYPRNADGVAIMVSNSGRVNRPKLFNIDIRNNVLNGETVEGCELPNTLVACAGDTPWYANFVDHAYKLLRIFLP
jgi:hypothetical protein